MFKTTSGPATRLSLQLSKLTFVLFFLVVSDHFGILIVNGGFVCQNEWDEKDAKVVCTMMGFSSETKGVPIPSGFVYLPPKDSQFIADRMNCKGDEDSLRHCSYSTSIGANCGQYTAAGVVCMDPSGLKLSGGSYAREGNVLLGDKPVCDKSWDKNDAQVVCNSLFGHEFDRGHVPVFKATTG